MLEQLIAHGSLALIFGALVVAGLGAPIPEDIVLLAGGALANRRVTSLPLTLGVCFVGVLCGDLLLFRMARKLGPKALERPFFRRILPPEKQAWIRGLFQRRGGLIVFAARHVAGLRAPVFAMAGIEGMPLHRFLLWDAAALCISAPLVFTLGYYFSAHLDLVRRNMARAEHFLLIGAVLFLGGYGLRAAWRRRGRRG